MWCKQEKDIPYLFGGAYAYAYSYFWHSFINFSHAYITADSSKLSKFLNKYDFADIPYNFWYILCLIMSLTISRFISKSAVEMERSGD
jgi:hypothetical protein